jgi:hypothetical protein
MPVELPKPHDALPTPGLKDRDADSDLRSKAAATSAERNEELFASPSEDLQRVIAAFAVRGQAVDAILAPWRRALQPWFEAFRASAPSLKAASDGIPERYRTALLILAEHGWYLDPELPSSALFEFADELQAGHEAEVEQLLCAHIDSRLDALESTLAEDFPDRADVIAAAFRAHRNGEFLLSVPVILAQADGLAQELVGEQLYSRRKGRASLSTVFDTLRVEPLSRAVVAPLEAMLPLTASREQREMVTPKMNRHAILHGECSDYGTREVSARAISLLAYVSWVLSEKE